MCEMILSSVLWWDFTVSFVKHDTWHNWIIYLYHRGNCFQKASTFTDNWQRCLPPIMLWVGPLCAVAVDAGAGYVWCKLPSHYVLSPVIDKSCQPARLTAHLTGSQLSRMGTWGNSRIHPERRELRPATNIGIISLSAFRNVFSVQKLRCWSRLTLGPAHEFILHGH